MLVPLLTARESKDADERAIARYHLEPSALMEQAAAATVQLLEGRLGPSLDDSPGLIVAGTGNNGGDALAAARLLLARGRSAPLIIAIVRTGPETEGFRRHEKSLRAMGATFATTVDASSARWVVDGVFGVGLNRPPEGEAQAAIRAMNARPPGSFLLALDIPSGLSADSGQVFGEAVRATATVTFGFAKRGLFTGEAADYIGKITTAPIGLPRAVAPDEPSAWRVTAPVAPGFPARRAASHKGDFGFVECWLGERTMHGAAILAATAALRTGAGRAALRGDAADLPLAAERAPADLMLRPLPFDGPATTVLVVGPGFGRSSIAEKYFLEALAHPGPLVLDADALFFAAKHAAKVKSRRANATVLLPHPKEAAGLLGAESTDAIEKDRFAAVKAIANQYGAATVLKGHGTLITLPGMDVHVVDRGGPALAKGGTGDVLSGMVAALWANAAYAGNALAAATNAVWLHGYLGERWERRGQSAATMLASDLLTSLPEGLAEVEGPLA